MKAVFLDRDGVLNEEASYITDIKQVKMIKNAGRAVQQMNALGFKTIIITNQPAVGIGLCTENDLQNINSHICNQLAKEGGKIEDIYFCPHHPERGQGKYKADCSCRKPNPGMLIDAAHKHKIELENSYMIGDRTSDIKAGYQAGCTTILVKTGFGGNDGFKDAPPDYTVEDILAAAELIKKLEGGQH